MRADLIEAMHEAKVGRDTLLVPVPLESSGGVLMRYAARTTQRPCSDRLDDTGPLRCERLGVPSLTAAFRIYRDRFGPAPHQPPPSLDIVYGTKASAVNDRWMRSDPDISTCAGPVGTPELARGVLVDFESLRLPCPYIDEVPADQLLTGLAPEFVDALQDRVVLYGGSVAGINDWYATPTHGREPGVRIHAAALDNLISYGWERYKRADLIVAGRIVPPWIRDFFIVLGFVALAVLGIPAYGSDDKAKRTPALDALCRRLGVYTGAILLFIVLGIVLYHCFDLAVAGWISLFQLVGWTAVVRSIGPVEKSWAYCSAVRRKLAASNEKTSEGESS